MPARGIRAKPLKSRPEFGLDRGYVDRSRKEPALSDNPGRRVGEQKTRNDEGLRE
jgi:hypothetical protein